MTVLARRAESLTLFLIALAFAAGCAMSPHFLDAAFLLDSSVLYSELGLVALTLAMLVVSGEIDLSVASMIALSACIFATCVERGLSLPAAIAAGLASGTFMGFVNGVLVTRLGLPSLITTIGTLTLYRGLAQVLLGDSSVTVFPDRWVGIDDAGFLGVPAPVLILAGAAMLAALLLHGSVFGRAVVLVGANRSAARHAGIDAARVKLRLFALNGFVCAAAGLMMSSRLGVVRYDLASGAELQIVLVVLLGGVPVSGGGGTIGGVYAAFWLTVLLQSAMMLANIGVEHQLLIQGLLLVGAVALPRLRSRRT
jgi:rhamnose transport system permease protein